MKQNIQLIEQYLADRRLAWAPSTQRSERHRLMAVAEHLDGNPETLWAALADLKPYARATAWTRVTDFWDWAITEGKVAAAANRYQQFRKKNALQFKNAYTRQVPSINYEEAEARCQQLPAASRDKALQLLRGGLRFAESATLRDGAVVGKGGKQRRVYVDAVEFNQTYETFRQHLAVVGLKPHTLRKLFASKLVAEGANEFDLLQIMGWSSLTTASSYVKTEAPRLAALVGAVQGVRTNGNKEGGSAA